VPKDKINRKYVHLFGQKIKDRKIKNVFLGTENEKENKIWSTFVADAQGV